MGRQEDLIEANKRGLLTGKIKEDFDQAVSRGLITIDAPVEQPITPAIQIPQTGLEDMEFFKSTLTPEQRQYFDVLQKRGRPEEREMSVAAFDPEQVREIEPTIPEEDFIKPMTWKNVISGAVSNTPKSAAQFVKDVISPFLSPVETAKALGGLAQGLGQKMIPGRQQQEQIVDDLVEVFKDRYGGIENLKKTISEDPVGVVADISSVLVPAGTAAKIPGVTAKVGKVAAKTGAAIEPLGVVTKAAKAIGRKVIPKETPAGWYQSAAKFSTTIPESVRQGLAKTALSEEIMPTMKGLDKLREKINTINSDISDLIDQATVGGEKIPIKGLFTKLGDLRKEAALSGEPLTQKRAIDNIATQISKANKKLGKEFLTPKEVQTLKQNIYKETESLYSKATQKPIKGKTKQAIARAAKESLENIFPEIKQLNKQDGSLIALRKELEKSASRISNRDLLGIGVPIKGVAGGTVGGLPGMVGMATLGLLDTPSVKAKLAIVANRLKKKGIVLAEDSALSRILSAAPGMGAVSARQAEKIRQIQETR